MFITILGSALGFATSAIPRIFDMVDEWQDRKHELSMVDRQMEMAKIKHEQRLEEINVQADIAETTAIYKHDSTFQTGGFIGGLRASVRPVVTYVLLLLWCFTKVSALYVLINLEGMMIAEAWPFVWSEETDGAIFAAVLSFWFGSRAMQRTK
jgi:hypothetical protein